MLVEVSFKGNRKEFFLWESEEPLPLRVPVIVEADRGEDLGYVHAIGPAAEHRLGGVPHAPEEGRAGVTLAVRRRAGSADVKRLEELRAEDDSARRISAERARASGLAMKVTDAEWRWDRRKLTLFFTADKRVDFRTLVKELAASFRTRIELKQIGVRDEAKRLGGIGRCGREYCSASWLPELRPVNLGVAREQRLSLNPTQISGACGRLMCCLRYEHDFYVQQRKRFPKEGKIIETSRGEEKVIANDIFRERVTLRGPEGESRIVPLAELRREWKNAPAALAAEDDLPPTADEGVSDEVLRMQDTAEMPAWVPRSGAPASRRELPVREAGDRRAPARPPAHSPRPPRNGGEGPARGSVERPAPKASGPSPAPPAEGAGDASADEARRGRRRRGRRGGRRPDRTAPDGEGETGS